VSSTSIQIKDVFDAREFLTAHLSPTRLIRAPSLDSATGAEVWLKMESEQPTASFKVRGALNALHRRSLNGALPGVVTSSTGNHGAAVAFAAQKMGIAAKVFLPENPNPVKRARIAALGAEIVEAGSDLEESRRHAARFSKESGWPLIVDVDDPDITAGAATIGWEILQQLPNPAVIFLPVGDSCLIRGVAFAVKAGHPQIRIIGVQAEGAPAYFRSWNERRSLDTPTAGTIADGLAARTTTPGNVRQLVQLVDEMRLVSDGDLLRAIRWLRAKESIVAEPAGAASTAALLLSGKKFAGTKVVLLVTGANVTPEILQRADELPPEP
jgi:threonine dehydratase